MSANRKPREARVGDVMVDHLAALQPLSGRVLAVDDELGRVEAELARRGALVSAWRRRAAGVRPARARIDGAGDPRADHAARQLGRLRHGEVHGGLPQVWEDLSGR